MYFFSVCDEFLRKHFLKTDTGWNFGKSSVNVIFATGKR